jgi:hypothetical protein
MTIEQTQIEIAKQALEKGYDVEIDPKVLIQLCEVVAAAREVLAYNPVDKYGSSCFVQLQKSIINLNKLKVENENMG